MIHQAARRSSRIPLITTRMGFQPLSALRLLSSPSTSSSGSGSPNITLYQYATCPFCNRVKSNFDYLNVDYKVVEVNPMSKKEIKSLNQKQVPVAVINGNIIADSAVILQQVYDNIDTIDTSHINRKVFMSEESDTWSKWSADRLAVLLYPNITRTLSDSWAAFAYVNDVKDWSFMEKLTNRMLGPVAMFLVRNKIKHKYGIVDEQSELLAVLSEWTDAIAAASASSGESKFLGGSSLTQADLMVFGVLRGLAGLPAHDFVMAKNKALLRWYTDVESEIVKKSNKVTK
mmetsp:Transcript_36039/g.67194  ORF Transcript_36039/g.67194 Transcript_36039/m.67194 type:complete len:288 (-) Transcript_36039:10-873(-)